MGVQFRMGTSIKKIQGRKDGKLEIVPAGKPAEITDTCLVTSSPGQLAEMAVGLPEIYLEKPFRTQAHGRGRIGVELEKAIFDGRILLVQFTQISRVSFPGAC